MPICTEIVQTQYVFIHDALNELIACGDTEISATNLRITTGRLGRKVTPAELTGFQNQFEVYIKSHVKYFTTIAKIDVYVFCQTLVKVTSGVLKLQTSDALREQNECKNQFQDKIPCT